MTNIIVALLLFSFIVFFHEFGHFLAARAMRVRVLEFALGMGPRLFSVQPKETVYSVRALPIGGFCSMLGEDSEEEEGAEDSLNQKSPWARLFIVVAGPLFNFLLAFFLALFIVAAVGVDRPALVAVTDGYPAAEAGIRAGDLITEINGRHIVFFREITDLLYFNQNEAVDVTVQRQAGGEEQEFSFRLVPQYSEEYQSYMLGIQVQGGRQAVRGTAELVYYAAQETHYAVSSTIRGLLLLIKGRVSTGELTGPVGIIGAIGETVDETRQYGLFAVLLNLAGLGLILSANLGVMNLLPIPALDGGRLVFCLIEGISRRSLNRKVEGYIHLAGFVLLMALMVFVMFNDIGRLTG